MAVNNEVSTENVKKAGEYFSQVLRVNWKKPEKEIKVDDSTFGQMAKEAVYAASMFLHPISRGLYAIRLQEKKISTDIIPDEKKCKHVVTIASCYSTGKRDFPRADIQEMQHVCDSLVKCINATKKVYVRNIK